MKINLDSENKGFHDFLAMQYLVLSGKINNKIYIMYKTGLIIDKESA
jgi:hypothetical protein